MEAPCVQSYEPPRLGVPGELEAPSFHSLLGFFPSKIFGLETIESK